MKITEFKKGDLITRVKPSIPYTKHGEGDRSYMGDTLIYVEHNQKLNRIGLIRCEDTYESLILDYDIFYDDWERFDSSMEKGIMKMIAELVKEKISRKIKHKNLHKSY